MKDVRLNLTHGQFCGLVSGLQFWTRLQGRRAFDFDIYDGYMRSFISKGAICEVDFRAVIGDAILRIEQRQNLKFLSCLTKPVMGTEECKLNITDTDCELAKGCAEANWATLGSSETSNFYLTRAEMFSRIPRDAATLTAFFRVDHFQRIKRCLCQPKFRNPYHQKYVNIESGKAKLVGTNFNDEVVTKTHLDDSVETEICLNIPILHSALQHLHPPVSIAVYPLLGKDNAWVTETRGFADKNKTIPARVLEAIYALDPRLFSENKDSN